MGSQRVGHDWVTNTHTHTHTRSSTTVYKGLRKNMRDREIGKHKLNEMGALNMKYKKWNKLDKSKKSSYSPIVFKCYLEIFEKYKCPDILLFFPPQLQICF